jgi:DNA-binding NtrC family response regulator
MLPRPVPARVDDTLSKVVHIHRLEEVERTAILEQLHECCGNLTETARRLGIARSTLYARLAKLRAAHSAN